jgi:hypothetical protein
VYRPDQRLAFSKGRIEGGNALGFIIPEYGHILVRFRRSGTKGE